MGILDSIKGLFGGNKDKVKDGIDKVGDTAASKAPEHAAKIEQGTEAAKDAVDKIPD